MSKLSLNLLGAPRLENAQGGVQIKRRKSLALLAYLAVTAEVERRDTLAALFWPESAQDKARATFRGELSHLQQMLGSEWLETDRETVALRQQENEFWLDVKLFEAYLADSGAEIPTKEDESRQIERLSKAIELYRGDFMAGFTLADSPAFDEWQFFRSEGYRHAISRATEQLVAIYTRQENFDAALPYAQRWCALDVLHEPAHRALMQLYAWSGHHSAALRQYESCKRLLAQELEVLPEEATTMLYEAIRLQHAPYVRTNGTLLHEKERLPQTRFAQSEAASIPTTATSLASESQPMVMDEIRVVTIVAASINYSGETLWSLRPDEAADQLGGLRVAMHTIFAQYEIHTEHATDGGMVAVFGAPKVHEDDSERALQAALQIRKAAQNMGVPIAIGIHSGPVYLTIDRLNIDRLNIDRLNDGKEMYTSSVLGATVTLALRLQGKAGDGQILVSKNVYRQTRRAFDFEPCEPDLIGPAIPFSAFLLRRPRQRMEKSRGIEGYQPTLIGRDNELAKLEQLVNELPSGEGHLVILSGEAGVGKSQLIARLKANVLGANAIVPSPLWLEGRCLEMTMSVGYGPFLDLLREFFAWEPDEDEPARAERLLMTLQELARAGHLTLAQIDKIGPLLGNLFSLNFGNEWDEQLRQTRPEQIRQQTFQAIYELLVALAQHQPLLLVFEDLHWADGVSLDLIAQLMEALSEIPLLLLCVCRPEQAHRSNQMATIALRKCLGHFTEITLRELPPRQSLELLHAYLGDALPDKVTTVILKRTQGNPFFIEEMIHTLISMDLLYQAEGRWLPRGDFDDAIVPDSVQSLLLSRVDRLLPEHKTVLHHAAVLGRLFSMRLLALTLPSQTVSDDLLWQLEEQALIYQERTIPEVIYSFRHILTHESIYATIPRRRAKRLHSEVAAALENTYAEELAEHYDQLAYHYERSEEVPKAVDYLLKAAQKAQRAYLNEEAIGYFDRALSCLDKLPANAVFNEQRLAALNNLGRTYYHGTSQLDQAEICFRQALALGKSMALPPRPLARILVWLGDLLMNWQPRFDESLSLGHEALVLLGNDNQCNEAAWANTLIYFSNSMTGNVKDAVEYGMRNAAFAHRLSCTEEFDHLVYISICCSLVHCREPEEARIWIELSAHNAERDQLLHALGEANTYLSYLSAAAGNTQVSFSYSQKALDVMLQAGDVKRANWSQMAMLWSYLQLGNLQAFRQLAPLTLKTAQLVNREYLHDLYSCMGIGALAMGAWQEAESHFDEAAQWGEPDHSAWAEAQVAYGYALLAQDKQVAASSVLKAVASSLLGLPDFALRCTRATREYSSPLISALTGLDAALADAAALQIFCTNLQTQQSSSGKSQFMQWFLEKAEIDHRFGSREAELADDGWHWRDRFGDCTRIYDAGLVIQSPNARDLWLLNESAPRLMRPMQADFAMQARCEAASSEKPALGGILLWHNPTNFIRLDWGSRGVGEVTLMGCINRQDMIVGRGQLHSAQAYLRLERRGDQVRAFCSDNGEEWYTVGHVKFHIDERLEAGLYAVGNIDRMLYHGAFPDGSAIRFSDFSLFTDEII